MRLPAQHEAIRAKCFHPRGRCIEFKKRPSNLEAVWENSRPL
jgi:hypothetical protein